MNKILKLLPYIKWRYLFFHRSIVVIERGAKFTIAKGVKIKKSRIYIKSNSSLIIENNTIVKNTSISTSRSSDINNLYIGKNNIFKGVSITLSGLCNIGEYNIFETVGDSFKIQLIFSGHAEIGAYNYIKSKIWMRFNSQLKIGNRNAINQRTEIRVDEEVSIGDYNQISYDCVIWDTNTHNIYSPTIRREMTDLQYPQFGCENEKPKTKPVIIGNDCWIGRYASILKGATINDRSIVAYHTVLLGGEYVADSVIMNQYSVRVKNNNE